MASMARKLTITLDEAVYWGLHRRVGESRIGKFLESLARPLVVREDLGAAYQEMARDEERETEAGDWVESLVGDIVDEAR